MFGVHCILRGCLDAGKDSKSQAQKALKATKKGTWKKERKPRFSVVFHRPKTLQHPREPKYPRTRSLPAAPGGSLDRGWGVQLQNKTLEWLVPVSAEDKSLPKTAPGGGESAGWALLG